ncbi:hypothetical protein AB0K02_00900 [Streptomyces sp. NPDC049597]|uniref:hypothetical protein n=1 Tax=Streptomyces sp. NPDC049597 TaxID=3155276 RepID=UPI0034336348
MYVVAAGVSALAGLQRPALDSLMARIVPHHDARTDEDAVRRRAQKEAAGV